MVTRFDHTQEKVSLEDLEPVGAELLLDLNGRLAADFGTAAEAFPLLYCARPCSELPRLRAQHATEPVVTHRLHPLFLLLGSRAAGFGAQSLAARASVRAR